MTITLFDIVNSQLKKLEHKTGYTLQIVLDNEHTTGKWFDCVVEIKRAMKHAGFYWEWELIAPNNGRTKFEYTWRKGNFENKWCVECDSDGYFYPVLQFALETLDKYEKVIQE